MKKGILQYLKDSITDNKLRIFNKNMSNLLRQEQGVEQFRLIKIGD